MLFVVLDGMGYFVVEAKLRRLGRNGVSDGA